MMTEEVTKIGEVKNSFQYVYPVSVKNINQPWIEIVEQMKNDPDFHRNNRPIIIIEPKVGCDHLDLNAKAFGYIPTYGSYAARDISENIYQIDLYCLKNSKSFKYVSRATEMALSQFMCADVVFDRYDSDIAPIFIINTRCESCIAPLNAISELIRELVISSVNYANQNYPDIFVAFDDMNHVWNDEPKKDKKKKKKKKKK